MLQIFISIQSLIMVEEPYYTEVRLTLPLPPCLIAYRSFVLQPGFDKQSSTIEGRNASDLYNERTFVLTRAFVQRALEYPPSDFQKEIQAYYRNGLPTTGPALAGIVEQSRLLLEESVKFHEDHNDGEEGGEGEEGGGRKGKRSVVIPAQNILTEGAVISLKRTLAALEKIQALPTL